MQAGNEWVEKTLIGEESGCYYVLVLRRGFCLGGGKLSGVLLGVFGTVSLSQLRHFISSLFHFSGYAFSSSSFFIFHFHFSSYFLLIQDHSHPIYQKHHKPYPPPIKK